MLYVKVIIIILYYFSQVLSADIPIIINFDSIKNKEENQCKLNKNITNDNTNINYTKKMNSKIEEEKEERNHEEILIKSNIHNQKYSVIEAKLPNPYLNTELVKKKQYINFNIKSTFKSKYADYLKKTYNNNKNNEIKNISKIKKNKTHKFFNLIDNDNFVYFTNIKINKGIRKRNKTLTGKAIKYSNNIMNEKNKIDE